MPYMAIGKPITTPKAQMVVGRKPSIKALVQAGQAALPISSAPRANVEVFAWTPEKKAIVFNMLKWGLPIEDVAVTVGCGVSTLHKYCKEEIRHARIHANTKVAEVFYKMAVSGKVPAATMQWMKTRVAGFKESIEHTGEIAHTHASTIDPSKLTLEQLRALEAIHAASRQAVDDTIDTTAEPA